MCYSSQPYHAGQYGGCFGLGAIGQMVVQQAKLQGAGLLFASDPISIRRQMAAQHGADVVIDPTTDKCRGRCLDRS